MGIRLDKKIVFMEELQQKVFQTVKPVPFRGIDAFFDISPLLKDSILFKRVIQTLVEQTRKLQPTIICALDARGFLFGAPVALELELPLVMIRKHGKLPGTCTKVEFNKEYESGDVFEIQSDALGKSDRAVVIDDVLATGGSMRAAFEVIRSLGISEITGVCLMDLNLPGSREFLSLTNMSIWSLLDVTMWKS